MIPTDITPAPEPTPAQIEASIVELLKTLPRNDTDGAVLLIYDKANIRCYTQTDRNPLFRSMYSLFKQNLEFAQTVMGAAMKFMQDNLKPRKNTANPFLHGGNGKLISLNKK